MPAEYDVKNRLSSIPNWTPVSYKQDMVKKLTKLLREGEIVADLLEGFYNGVSIRGTDTGVSGVLFFTDRRILFITNEKRRPDHEELRREDALAARTERGFATVSLFVSLPGGEIQFDTVSSTAAVERAISYLTGDLKRMTLEHAPQGFARQPAPDTFFRQTAERLIQKQGGDILDDFSKYNFLFLEAKKLIRLFQEYTDFDKDSGFLDKLLKDILLLCSLCFPAKNSIYEESKLFLALLLLPFHAHTEEFETAAKEMYSLGSFPLHYKDTLLAFYRSKDWLTPAEMKGDEKLPSMEHLSRYDAREGSDHLIKMSAALYTLVQCFIKADGTVNEEEKERLKKLYTLIYDQGKKEAANGIEEKTETMEEVLAKLNKLIGMDKIKDQIKTFINLISIQKERKERNLPITPFSLHAVFYGPPGTGKTTIARLLGKIYKHLGLLSKGQLVETDRAGLVAGYVGQTAKQVDEVIQTAMDGILFIDEAYTLSPEDAGKDFGQEVIDTMLKRMEDYRDRFAVIVAGYPDEMRRFIYSNPGLKSRFSRYFYFDHYTPEELIGIYDIFTKDAAFVTGDDARETLKKLLTELYENRTRTFGNGRLVRNIFEKIVEKQANRLSGVSPLTDELLCAITPEDIPTLEEMEE